ncbi:MAG: acyl-CoA dehydrogenase family protein [Pseudomonadota bacterium]
MDFEHTEDRRMLQDSLNRFLKDKYPIETRHAAAASDAGWDAGAYAQMAELGVVGALIPEAAGGFGGAGFDVMVVFEALGRALSVEPVLATGVLGAGPIIALAAEAKSDLLEEVVAGAKTLALAHGEPDSRYELAQVSTKAEGGKLSGRKAVVINGGSADLLVVSARTSGGAADEDGISLYLVDPKGAGVTIRETPSVDGGRVAEITLDGAPGELIGEEGKAFAALEKTAAAATVALCAEALGAMVVSHEMTVDYTKQRKQFGRPIGTFQALQHRMVDMGVEIEQARSAVINAAGRLDADRAERELYVSAAKNMIGRAGKYVAEEAIQIHGGIGMTWEYAVGHYAKRIIMIDHVLGDADHHLERFIRLSKAA